MNFFPAKIHDATRCPLCEKPNACQLCTAAAYKGACWCQELEIPGELLARVTPELRNKACICQPCVEEFHRQTKAAAPPPKILPGDFYFENGLMVLNASYLLRRGYCCGHGCRHCPYGANPHPLAGVQ